MMHYGILQWADFARGVAPEEERKAMQAHLETGCPACVREAAFCERLGRLAASMTAQRVPPEAVVRLARAICPARPTRTPRFGIRIPVELVFDSFLVPSPAGLRASWQVGWQALYRAGNCSLDVRIEPDLSSSRAALIGQVSNHETPDTQMENLPVCLKSGRRVVAETRSNQFGEFQMEYDQQKRLELCIQLDGGARRVVAPLRRIAAQAAGEGGRLIAAAARKRNHEQG